MKNEKLRMKNYLLVDFMMATIILTISSASHFIASIFFGLKSFVSSHISSQKRVSSASSYAILSFDTNSALLLAQPAARIFAATLLPLLEICAAIVFPVKFLGKASASLNILTAKAFVLYAISGVFIPVFFTNPNTYQFLILHS